MENYKVTKSFDYNGHMILIGDTIKICEDCNNTSNYIGKVSNEEFEQIKENLKKIE